MTNDLIRNMLSDIHNGFFSKWRDCVPESDSPVWDQIYAEAMQLYIKYNNPQGRFLVMWLFNELMDRRKIGGMGDEDR